MSDWGLDVPHGRQLEDVAAVIHQMPPATPWNLAHARKAWPEAKAEDFERQGKLFVDKASGLEYRHVRGHPLLDRPRLRFVLVRSRRLPHLPSTG